MSTVIAAVLTAAVLAVIGVATYGLMGGFSGTGKGLQCEPITSPVCAAYTNLHDVALLQPFRSIQQGASVPFTASLPAGEAASGYTFDFGDGTPGVKSSTPTVAHAYASEGTYLVLVQASVGGVTHDNAVRLVQVQVTPAYAANSAGQLPGVSGAILGNSSAAAGARLVTAVLAPGQSVTVGGSYTAQPTDPLWSTIAPRMTFSTGGAKVSGNVTATSATETVSFATPGSYTITFVGGAQSANNSTVYQNYTWTVFVAPPGVHAGIVGATVHTSPHPGTIIAYELVPGGAVTEDPAIAYDTASAEPIYNVYQTLIAYNGTQTGAEPSAFVPELATCVPGSPECQALYGQSLVDGAGNYTFVISGAARFYDPATGGSWGVYPSDVVFSLARTMGFSVQPCVTCNNGWIVTQALLGPGNYTWDTVHGPFNNTPLQILNSMTVNGSACPPAATQEEHGCVTFHATGNHRAWPYFLELIADPLGSAIVPCGWFSAPAQGSGIPFWTAGNVSGSGDHPCALPGTHGYGLAPSAIPPTGWDRWEYQGSGASGGFQGHVQYNLVGSGPYYMALYTVGESYELKANPAYLQNPHCTWSGCWPAASKYASTVEVTWENSAVEGEQAYASGVADFASIPRTDIALMLQLIGQGKLGAISAPTITIGFFPFDLNYNLQSAQRFTTAAITAPSDWFSYLGMREFFAHAYPYATIESTLNTADGIQFSFNSGGAIPQFMGNFFPKGVPWPSSDPDPNPSDVGGAAWWWSQMHVRSSPYYDAEALACTLSNPCSLPLFGETGSPTLDEEMATWAASISTLTGGAVKVAPVDINFVQVIVNAEFSGPGQNGMPLYSLGWAPDYPDPTDYVDPLYVANGTYTYGDSVAQSLYQGAFGSGCSRPYTDYTFYANLTPTTLPQSCQAEAYKSMEYALGLAASSSDPAQRIALYADAETLANDLALYTYIGQSNLIASFASWIDPSSINTNITIGGGGDALWFGVTGNDVQGPGST